MVRFKNRYIVVEINPDESNRRTNPTATLNTSSSAISRSVLQKVEQLHGDFGCAAIHAGFQVKYCNEHTRIALIRIRCGPHRFVASAIPFVSSLEGRKISMHSLYTGATVKHCFQFIKQYQQKKIETELVQFKDKPEYETLCRVYMNITPAYLR